MPLLYTLDHFVPFVVFFRIHVLPVPSAMPVYTARITNKASAGCNALVKHNRERHREIAVTKLLRNDASHVSLLPPLSGLRDSLQIHVTDVAVTESDHLMASQTKVKFGWKGRVR